MFDFQKLDVYQKAKDFDKDITKTLASRTFDSFRCAENRITAIEVMILRIISGDYSDN